MYIKDIFGWSKLKSEINEEESRPNVKIREVRWCALGHNIGSEIDGKGDLYARPVLILKIISSHTAFVIPLTHSIKTGKHIYEFNFKKENIKLRLDQVRVIDIKRLKSKVGEVPQKRFQEIKEKLKEFIFE